MDRRRKGKTGLTLVELLVVLGIIATISAVSIPVIARSGLFTSNKSQLAARELFIVLRAAKIYATTHNVETAVAYGIDLVEDSFIKDPNFPGEGLALVPVVDSMTVVRRLKRKEMLELIQAGALTDFRVDAPLYVQVKEGNSNFKRMPNGTCILPDLFEFVSSDNNNYSATGLNGIEIFDPIDGQFLSPRTWNSNDDIKYILSYGSTTAENIFPAHLFSPEGALLADAPQQRLRFRVGVLPTEDPTDRFFVDIGHEDLDPSRIDAHIDSLPILFSEMPAQDSGLPAFERKPLFTFVLHDPDRPVSEQTGDQIFDTPADIDVDIFLYVPTGRVKVGS